MRLCVCVYKTPHPICRAVISGCTQQSTNSQYLGVSFECVCVCASVCVYFWHKVGAFKGGGGGLVAVGRTFIVPFLSQ